MVRPNASCASLPRPMSDRPTEPDEAFLPPEPGERSARGAGAASDEDERGDEVEAGDELPLADGARADHELIRRAQAGDEDAFGDLVRRHQQRAFRVARNLVPNREDALDLSQEAFLRVYRNLARFDFHHEFTTWLYRIVTNLCIDHLRKRRPAMSTSAGEDEEPDFDLPDEGAPMPYAALEREEVQARVREVIDSLAPHFQTVLALRELEGLACTEIARIVDATHVTVRWRLHRGRKLFQEEWERRERLAAASAAASLELPPPAPNTGADRAVDREGAPRRDPNHR